jgi:precorrin-6Y C5,15-methyltransferase (decarboxylating)
VVARVLQPGRRAVVYASGENGAAEIARILGEHGFGASRFVVLERLGAEDERITDGSADDWGEQPADPLHAIAIEAAGGPALALVPGLPDEAYDSDGQLTKRHVRAATLAALGPLPGELLWDVGAGSGSIAIEWLRAEPSARAIAVESRLDRAARIAANAGALGVPDRIEIGRGEAPDALNGLDRPQAIFIGGGLTADDLLEHCWRALMPGGRLVANAVTLESEQVLVAARERHGGELTRIEISHAEPIGGFSGWRAQLPVVQWSLRREAE